MDCGPLGNYVVIDGERMTGSRNLGGNEEVVRLDVGPYDLERETVAVTLVHRGRQRVAIVRLADQDGNTIVELRSDSVYDDLWLRDNRSVPYRSGIVAGTGWRRSVIRLASGTVTVTTGTVEKDSEGAPWATVVPDDTYPRHAALAAVVVALGDAGGFYVDSIAFAATTG